LASTLSFAICGEHAYGVIQYMARFLGHQTHADGVHVSKTRSIQSGDLARQPVLRYWFKRPLQKLHPAFRAGATFHRRSCRLIRFFSDHGDLAKDSMRSALRRVAAYFSPSSALWWARTFGAIGI